MRNDTPLGFYKALLLAGCAGAVALASPAMAQQQTPDADEETGADILDTNTPGVDPGQSPNASNEGQTIVVTGSRIARQDFEANSPFVTVDEALLEQSSTAALESNLNKLPQFVPAQTPTAGADIQPTATNTPGAATVSLRGIGANRNLVLLDGRRATPSNASGVVDISTIPSAAIERVEVISGGASATYGADAVAGVTNFILKKNFEGVELDGQMGLSQEGDGFEYQISGIMGTEFSDGRGNVSLAMSMNTREESLQRNRSWYRDLWADPQTGGTQFFIDRPGVILGNGNPIDPNVFFGVFNQANPADQPFNPATATCGPTPAVTNPINNGACFPFTVAPGVTINVTSPITPGVPGAGAQGFTIFTNPDGSVFTGTDFNQRGGAYRFQGFGQNGYERTAAGTIAQNNENLQLILPLTRYNAFARGNYEITDTIGIFGQALFSSVSTSTRNEPGPITTGWDASVPYGTAIYTGDTARGIPSSVNADGTTNQAYLSGGQYGLNCPAIGGCPTYQVFPVSAELQQLLLARADPNAPISVTTLLPDPRETFTDVTTMSLIAGLEGSIPGLDWTWEAFVNHGESSTYARQTGIFSLERTRLVLSSPNFGRGFIQQGNAQSGGFGASTGQCTSGVNFFNPPAGGFSEDCLEAMRADLVNRTKVRQTVAEANLQGELIELPAGELRFAAGASLRELDFRFQNDTLTTQGRSFNDQALGIYPSGNAEGFIRTKELYGELLIPIIGDLPFVEQLNLELGGRMSDYSTTGTSYTYKILGDLEVNDWLRFRGGYNRAERAPNIGELYLAAQQTFGVNLAGDPCSTANPTAFSANAATNAGGAAGATRVRQICSVLLNQAGPTAETQFYGGVQSNSTFGFAFPTTVGNANLTPEKADTWTAGVVVQSPFDVPALSRLRLTVDWFDISVTDAIAPLTVAAALQSCFDPALNPGTATEAANSSFCQNVPRNATGQLGNVFLTYTNFGRFHVQGIDTALDWAADVGPGTLTVNALVNYLTKFESAPLAGAPMVDYVGTFGTTENGLNTGAFEYRVLATLGYGIGPARVALQWQHLPSVEDSSEALFRTTDVGAPSYNLFALNMSYDLTPDIGLRFGVENLLNEAPPLTNYNPANNNPAANGQLRGGSFNSGYYDTQGRRFYLGANVQF